MWKSVAIGSAPGAGIKQVRDTGIDRDKIPDLQPRLRLQRFAQRDHHGDTARSGDVHIFIMFIKQRYRNAGDRPDVVVVDL